MRSLFGVVLALAFAGLPLAAQDKKQQESKQVETPKIDDSRLTPKGLIKAVADDLNAFQKRKERSAGPDQENR